MIKQSKTYLPTIRPHFSSMMLRPHIFSAKTDLLESKFGPLRAVALKELLPYGIDFIEQVIEKGNIFLIFRNMIRLHRSNQTIFNFNKKYKYKNGDSYLLKPEGFWYSVDDAWTDWLMAEGYENDSSWCKKYEYKITINDSNLLVLETKKQTKAFVKEYTIKNFGIETIDWLILRKKYSGIEIRNYFRELRRGEYLGKNYLWYNAWDCASGCVWDISAIRYVDIIKDIFEDCEFEEFDFVF